MTVKKFRGIVRCGDPFRVAYQPLNEEEDPYANGAVHIGERDFVDEVAHHHWTDHVTVAIGDDKFHGDTVVMTGWGYSEFTPMDPDEFTVGDTDIIKILQQYEGEWVTVWVADEPFNTLE